MKIIGSNEKKFLQYFSDADSVAAQKIVRQVYMIDYN